MASDQTANLLPVLTSSREYFAYLDEWTVGTVDQLNARRSSHALVKGFLLETSRVSDRRNTEASLHATPQTVTQVDDSHYRLLWPGEDHDWAIVDASNPRYPTLYTAVESPEASHRVDQMLASSPLLDRAWISSEMFQGLWNIVVSVYPEYRLSQLVFEHESIFESGEEMPIAPEDLADGMSTARGDGSWRATDRRRARIQITERLGKLQKALPSMQSAYDPLASIVRLRMPAPQRGGHDIYFDGRFTNRSDSVTSFQQTIRQVSEIYQRSTQEAEEEAWPSDRAASPAEEGSFTLGAPLLIKFEEQLDLPTFDRWIASLKRKQNRFRLWGNPIPLGPGKIHLYAVDNHLWQPIDLEITQDHLYALLPAGTCGNTIHRLVTTIQRYVSPRLKTYIGDRPYSAFLDPRQSE